MKRKIKVLFIIVLIFGALVLLRLFSTKSSSQMPNASVGNKDKVVVKAMIVEKSDLNLILYYVGNIKAKDEASVFSKVAGKLAEYTVSEGEGIEKGQTIALVDRDETGLKFELAKVESPISGVVGRTMLDKGANVLAGAGMAQGTPIALIVNMEEMIVRLNISESDIPYIKNGLNAAIRVDSYPEEKFTGQISKVSEVVDLQTRTLPIEITMPNNDHRLKSGMFARIEIIASRLEDRLVLSQDALVQEFGTNYVFVVEDYTAKKRKVEPGIKEDSRIEIKEGLKEGERVIVFGQQGLKDGTSVELVQE